MTVPIGGPPLPESSQSVSRATDLTSSGLHHFLLNHMLGIRRALTTSELRHRAATAGYSAELIERVYSHLVALQRQGHIARVWERGRVVYWAATQTWDSTLQHRKLLSS